MKKAIITSALGIVASVAMISSSYGQGYVTFENNNFGSLNAPVTFAAAGLDGATVVTAGEAVGSTFTAVLLYSLNSGTSWESPAGTATAFQATDGDSANFAGYFFGPTVTLPDYVSGSVEFMVEAYNGASYGAAGFWNGSTTFTLGTIANGTPAPAPGDFGSAMQPFTVSQVPEPTTLALAGLGGAALLAFRRRKA